MDEVNALLPLQMKAGASCPVNKRYIDVGIVFIVICGGCVCHERRGVRGKEKHYYRSRESRKEEENKTAK